MNLSVHEWVRQCLYYGRCGQGVQRFPGIPLVSPSLGPMEAEDEKLATLARSARARTNAAEGAAVRDDMGRTYVAATVALPGLSLPALSAAVAAAASSGAAALEAAVVVTAAADVDRAVLEGLGDPAVFVLPS